MSMNMRQGPRLGMHLTQGLYLTPQMRMNLELIQAPILEALETLDQKVLENPFLEHSDTDADPRLVRDADVEPESTITARDQAEFEEAEAWTDPVASTPFTHEEAPADEVQGVIQARLPTPYEQLEAQLCEVDTTRKVQDILRQLLAYLDDNGFLLFPADELFEMMEMPVGTGRKEFDEALRVLRYEFDPAGLGATDQSHCYLLQLERRGKNESLAARLVRENVLSAIKPRNLAQVAKKLGVREEELHSALEDLHRLYSSPLALLDQTTEPTRYPDLIVEKIDGEWIVNLSHPLTGRYRFAETPIPRKNAYLKEAAHNGTNGDDPAAALARLRQMRQDAKMLVSATEYRDRTLYEIGRKLVAEQREFMEVGEEGLKPYLQKELAESLSMNEATISRILKEKYMQSPRGVIPLSKFFSRAIQTDDGESVSNKKVQDALQKLIGEEEDPESPWSDQEISDILKQRNLPISRRTVTKYRQILGIGAAGDRKAMRRIQDGK